jgi:uncharacterized damage-inducible protein DinB
MSASNDLLIDGFGRIRDLVHEVVDGLSPDELATRLDDGANSITWLVWHLTRIQDDHISDVAGSEQVWTGEGWFERFELPFKPAAPGYGHARRDVAAMSGVSAELLTGYHEAVHERTVAYVRGLTDKDFAGVIDTSWTPAVTLGVRLISVLADDLQHVGQAAFIRGALERG